jgi:hypothetical protein
VPGRAIDLKDVLTWRHFQVLEQSASRTLRAGDLTYTRVVTAGGASIMIGASPWVIPPAWHLRVLDFRQQLRPSRLLTVEELRDYDIEIREFYHHVIDEIQHPRLPSLRNTDGGPIELTTMTYELGVTTAEAVERLRPIATLRGEAHVDGETYDDAGTLTAAELSWIKAGNRQHKNWDNTTLGTLRLNGARLVVEVNSARRRDQIAKEIAKRLGKSATLVETTVTDVMKELEARRTEGEHSETALTGSSLPERTPEIEALEAEMARKQWNTWIDTKVPALGNRTPRQAAKTPLGRERLAALLSDFGRMAERGPSAGRPDVEALRRVLGLN